jgi:4-hydroxybenzoate polyprenyltransferase
MVLMTKKQIGILLCLVGVLGVAAVIAYDILRRKALTPVQIAALGSCVGLFVMGAALLPLGDRPA